MGIQGLLPLLKSIQKPCSLKTFAGQTIGVDAYGWLHRGTIACAMELAMDKPTRRFVDFAMHRVRMLQHFGVIPFLVFDGDYLPSKAATEAGRRKKREESKSLGMDLLEAGKTSQAYLEFQKAIDVTPEMARRLIDELKKVGVQYLVAPYEADAQLVYLERTGLISAILSEDSDLLVFGAQCLLTKLDQYGNCVEVNKKDFCACREINLTGWSDAEFRCMAILSGCDYLDGIGKMGLKGAHSIVRKHKTIERVIRAMQFDHKYRVPKDYLDAFQQAELTFLHQRVYCPISNRLVLHTEPSQPIDEQEMPYIGAYIEPEIAKRVAVGELNPITKNLMLSGPTPTSNIGRTPNMTNKAQRRDLAVVHDLKKGVSIEQFFKPQKRIPLGELDPNSFIPSLSQRNALLRNNGPWLAESSPRHYLRRTNTDTAPQSQSTPISASGSNLPWLTTLSETRPQKRSRLCAEDVVSDTVAASSRLVSRRSPYFDSEGLAPSHPFGRSSKAKRSRNDDITIFSDDSVEEALLNMPEFDRWHETKPTNNNNVSVFNEEKNQEDRAQQGNDMDVTKDEFQESDDLDVSQISIPDLTHSSSIMSSADEASTPIDSPMAPGFGGKMEKFAFSPKHSSSYQQLAHKMPTLSPSLNISRIPRAIKQPTAINSSRGSVHPRVLTPLQSLGAKALNRSSKFPTTILTPNLAPSAALPRFKQLPSPKTLPLNCAPFPDIIKPTIIKDVTQLDPLDIPLPVPDQDELLALSKGVFDECKEDAPSLISYGGKGSEDLIVPDSEEELDNEAQSPKETTSAALKLGLDKFAFKG